MCGAVVLDGLLANLFCDAIGLEVFEAKFTKQMQTEVIKLDLTQPDAAEVEKAAKLLDAGGLVAFPTETVYGIACKVAADSIAKLDNLKNRAKDKHYTLHIGQKSDAEKYLPAIGLRAKKLIKNTWPGPLTIVFELSDEEIKKQQAKFAQEIFDVLYKNNSIGIRCPAHRVAAMLLQLAQMPVVAPSANAAGRKPAVTAKQVLEQFSGQIDALLDAGKCKYKENSTVVKIGKKGFEILRQGVYSQSQLETLSTVKFLFVCTGNTCRSPMAEAIFAKYLAEKLKCEVDQLEKMGYKTLSAGTMGVSGLPASKEAVNACAVRGIDIRGHASTGLARQLIEDSDLIFTMSRTHSRQVIDMCHEAADKCLLLAGNVDIVDPIGQNQQTYNSCADLIEKNAKKRIGEFII
ncbi:MAG: threonylcarbamoyl-AMP synthase [Planctomycetes bacterium]|nr:threonylcarbamoyl-AMP synthase [Planctomycetota bacterium]